jgi:hypothetical protein
VCVWLARDEPLDDARRDPPTPLDLASVVAKSELVGVLDGFDARVSFECRWSCQALGDSHIEFAHRAKPRTIRYQHAPSDATPPQEPVMLACWHSFFPPKGTGLAGMGADARTC